MADPNVPASILLDPAATLGEMQQLLAVKERAERGAAKLVEDYLFSRVAVLVTDKGKLETANRDLAGQVGVAQGKLEALQGQVDAALTPQVAEG